MNTQDSPYIITETIDDVIEIKEFYIPPSKRPGFDREYYLMWESNLPKNIKYVKLSDTKLNEFWENVGFDYEYISDDEIILDSDVNGLMVKGINGTDTPEPIYIDESYSDKILLNETEYGVLLGNTLSNFVSNRKASSARVQVVRTIFIPSFDNESLEIRATTNTEQRRYRTAIMFDEVEYLDEPDPAAATVIGSDSRKYYLNKIPLNQVDVKVKCSCPDFYYRFAVWNHRDDSLIGEPPPPYIKKTNRPPVNPNRVPGACKHIIKLTDKLMSQGLFK